MLLVEPVRWRLLPFGLASWPIISRMLFTGFAAVIAILLGADFQWPGLPIALLLFVMALGASLAIGVLSGAIGVLEQAVRSSTHALHPWGRDSLGCCVSNRASTGPDPGFVLAGSSYLRHQRNAEGVASEWRRRARANRSPSRGRTQFVQSDWVSRGPMALRADNGSWKKDRSAQWILNAGCPPFVADRL